VNDVNILKNSVMIFRTRRNIFVLLDQKNTNMNGFNSNIEKDAVKNENFRKVLYTSKHIQLVLMNLNPGENIGEETHPNIDQFFWFEAGNGKCIINGNEYMVENGDV
jgi:mannose-6-phosphate isomerase-like protein (cupin superfamily)